MKTTRPTSAAVLALLSLLPMRGGATEPPAPGPLTLRIVPSSHNEKTGRSIELYQPSQHFHVVVTNVSDRPVRLWREWCSWGYFNLSFVVTGEDGRSVTVSKKPRGWDRNFPDPIIVPPGGHRVYEVAFDAPTWQNVPLPERNRSRAVRMKAVYTIPADKDTRKFDVWTGHVSSPTDAYTLWR